MKTKLRIVSLICILVMLFASFATLVSASDEFEKPVEAGKWENPKWSTDHAYSIAFVGDTQYIACGDYYTGTNKMEKIYKFIADTAEERKLEHVFVLGDITDRGYWNDGQLAGNHYNPPVFGEWDIAFDAITQLSDAGISYSLCRGNHDDYSMDTYFNVPAYTDQFKDCGGFFSDVNGRYPEVRRGGAADMTKRNPKGYVLWSAKKYAETGDGRYTESIVNSYKAVEICGTKYLLVTLDYNPTKNTVDWLDGLLSEYSDHKAIITMHAYLEGNGTLDKDESDDTTYHFGFVGQTLWRKCLKNHENVFMVVSGHTGGVVPVYSINKGDNGNKVYQVLCDPQIYDAKEDEKGNVISGKQDTGLVLYMNFSKDGKTITFDYYSTLLGKFLKDSDYTINIEEEVDEVGSIDMADLAQFGQVTPLVKEKTKVTLDGVISAGEYPESKLTKLGEIAVGKLNSDLTEYFAYDDDYLYYAFTAKVPINAYKLNFHLGSSLYTLSELNGAEHSNVAIYTVNNGSCGQGNNTACSKLLEDDMKCKAVRDMKTGLATYEIQIRREYLSNNNSPDNLLSYTLNLGSGTHRFNLGEDAKSYLEGLGVTGNYTWTYNYAYFGTRPETVPDAPETEAVTGEGTGEDTSSESTANGGCGSSVVFAPAAIAAVAMATAVITKKRKQY